MPRGVHVTYLTLTAKIKNHKKKRSYVWLSNNPFKNSILDVVFSPKNYSMNENEYKIIWK